ncbi:hypothetical protein BDV93DRAFT_559992 [Ceratobasidium sp. AG-I]|nr:hypothetical protein BDV93DRAFT_559992 [Ceratobasidium sp. AG-I]
MPVGANLPSTLNTGVPLPVELLHMICQLLPIQDKKSLACTSQALWAVAVSWLWRDIKSLERLVHRMLDTTFVTSAPIADIFDSHIWQTFERIGPFVLSMATCDSERVQAGFPTVSLVLALVKRSALDPLFPNLQSLSVRRTWLDSTICILDVHPLNLLGSFLQPSVTRLVIEGVVQCFDMVQLQHTAPKIRELRLQLHPPPTNQVGGQNLDTSNNWIGFTMEGLVGWQHLTTLHITAALLNIATASSLGRIPLLAALSISGNGKSLWQQVAFAPGSFPHLREVATKSVPLNDLLILLNQHGSAKHLTKLCLHISPTIDNVLSIQQLEMLAACLRDRHPLVRSLGIHQAAELPLSTLQPLRALSLSTLVLRRVDLSVDTRPVLLTLHNGLEYLDLGRSPMPPKFLASLAAAYPSLRVLVVLLDFEHYEDVRDIQPDVVAEGPLQLYATAYPIMPVHNTQGAYNIKEIKRFVKRLWKTVRLRWK